MSREGWEEGNVGIEAKRESTGLNEADRSRHCNIRRLERKTG